jgi:hypothetical protein
MPFVTVSDVVSSLIEADPAFLDELGRDGLERVVRENRHLFSHSGELDDRAIRELVARAHLACGWRPKRPERKSACWRACCAAALGKVVQVVWPLWPPWMRFDRSRIQRRLSILQQLVQQIVSQTISSELHWHPALAQTELSSLTWRYDWCHDRLVLRVQKATPAFHLTCGEYLLLWFDLDSDEVVGLEVAQWKRAFLKEYPEAVACQATKGGKDEQDKYQEADRRAPR